MLVDRIDVEATKTPSKAVDVLGCGIGDLAVGHWLTVDLAVATATLEKVAAGRGT